MNELTLALMRIRRARRIDRALLVFGRAGLLIALVGCVLALSVRPSPAWLGAALVAAAVASIADAVRRVSLRACAAMTDRTLSLEERLSTSLEARGPLAQVQAADALRALQARLPEAVRVHPPREVFFAGVALLVALTLWAAPAPLESSASQQEVSVVRETFQKVSLAAEKLDDLKLAELKALVRKVAEKNEVTRDVLSDLQHAQAQVRSKLESATGEERRELEAIEQLLADAGYSAARTLRERGELAVEMLAPLQPARALPTDVDRDPTAQGGTQKPAALPLPEMASPDAAVSIRERLHRALERRGWPEAYDDIIRRFYQ